MFLGANIKYLRALKGITQTELAEVVGVKYTTVTGWETGKSSPHFQVLLQLREYFQVDLERLVYQDLQKETVEEAHSGTQGIMVEFEKLKSRMDALESRMAEVKGK